MWQKLLAIKAQLLAHEGFRRYGANTAWLMGEKVLRMFVGLFVGIWVARYLGPDQFGLLSYAQSFVFLFTAIATLGLDSIVIRELVKDKSQRDVLLGTAFALKLIGSICILPILWVAVQFTSNDSYTNLLIFIIASGTIFQSFNVIDFYYQSTVRSKYVALANTITLGLSSIIKIVLILNHASLTAFAIVGVFDSAILGLGLIYFYLTKTKYSIKNWKFDKSTAYYLIKSSWPLIFSELMISSSMRIDQIMIKNMLSNTELGLYAAAVRISEVWYFIPMVISSSVFPSIITSYTLKSNEEFKKQKNRFYLLMIIIGIIICSLTTLFSDLIVKLLYGQEYLLSAEALRLIVWVGVIVCFGSAWSKIQITLERQKYLMLFEVFSLSFNILFNYFLIKKYGINGAAISTIMAVIISYIIYFLIVYKGKNEKPHSFFHR